MSEMITEDNIDDFDDDLDEETTTTTTRKNSRDIDKPVANADDIPLFADANKRGLNTATVLKIIKLDAPNSGYKGSIPVSSTEETISQLYGDGWYKVELCNQNGKALRTKEIKISLGIQHKSNGSENDTPAATDQHLAALIKSFHISNKEDKENLIKILQARADDAKELATAHTTLVTKTTEAAAQREREHMKGINESQQTFFGNLLMFQANQFQQMMALMQTSHQQTMEQLRAAAERDREMNSPALLMGVLMKGLELGQGMNDDREPWERTMTTAVDGLDKLLQLKNGSPVMQLSPQSTTPNPGNTPNQPNKTNDKKNAKITSQEAKAVLELKAVLRKRGIDFADMLNQNVEHYREIPDDKLFRNEDNSDTLEGEANDSPEETSETNMED